MGVLFLLGFFVYEYTCRSIVMYQDGSRLQDSNAVTRGADRWIADQGIGGSEYCIDRLGGVLRFSFLLFMLFSSGELYRRDWVLLSGDCGPRGTWQNLVLNPVG